MTKKPKQPKKPDPAEVSRARAGFAKVLREMADAIEKEMAVITPIATTKDLMRFEVIGLTVKESGLDSGHIAVEWFPDSKEYWAERTAAIDALNHAETSLRKARDEAMKFGVVR